MLVFVCTVRINFLYKLHPKGCDTGFGNKLAKRLVSKGYHVFAGCLFPDGGGAHDLKREFDKNITIIPLDVTNDDSVLNARKLVQNSLRDKGLNELIIEIHYIIYK